MEQSAVLKVLGTKLRASMDVHKNENGHFRGGGFDRGRRDGGRDGGRGGGGGSGGGGFRREGRGTYDHFEASDRRLPRHQGGGFTHGNIHILTYGNSYCL